MVKQRGKELSSDDGRSYMYSLLVAPARVIVELCSAGAIHCTWMI